MMLPPELVKVGRNPMATAEYYGSRRAEFKAFELAMKEALIMIDMGYVDVEIISTSSYPIDSTNGTILITDNQNEFMQFSDVVRKKRIKLTLAGINSGALEVILLGDQLVSNTPHKK